MSPRRWPLWYGWLRRGIAHGPQASPLPDGRANELSTQAAAQASAATQPAAQARPRNPNRLVVKAPSPLLGFNNNVRHRGRVFHIQTEDSGVRHPHVITHLFADGGRILKTIKTSYAEHIGQDRLTETVRGMMQEQHKGMFIALRDGQFDHLFDESAANSRSVPSQPRSGQRAPAEAPPVSRPVPGRTTAEVLAVEPSTSRVAGHAAPHDLPPPTHPSAGAVPQAQPADVRKRPSRPTFAVDGAVLGKNRSVSAVSATAPTLTDQSVVQSIDLDLDALERAAAEAQTPFFQQIQDLPPPPAAVLGNRRAPAGGYSVRPPTSSPQPETAAHRPSVPPPGSTRPSLETGRYAPSRPASIFATTRPPEGASIFGEDLISEKSLDEVILGYLAEDLDSPEKK